MIALTSITPSHINENIQEIAVNSWLKLGFEVFSFNGAKEIEILKPKYPQVTFIESPTYESIYGKPKVGIDSILEFEHEDSERCVINSDIILIDSKNVFPKIRERLPDEATIVQRLDFINDVNKCNTFRSGIDVFFLHKNYLHLINGKGFVMGECYWDYQVPYSLLTNHKKVHLLKEPFAYHRMHNTQYGINHWHNLGMYFSKLHGLNFKNSMQVNDYAFDYIFKNVI